MVETPSEGRVERTFSSRSNLVAALAPPQVHRLTARSDMMGTSLEQNPVVYPPCVGLSHGPNRTDGVQGSYWDDDPGYHESSIYLSVSFGNH